MRMSEHKALYKIASALPVPGFRQFVQTQQFTSSSPEMTSSNHSSTDWALGIIHFHLTGMKAQKTWSGGDIEDGRGDPAATMFRLEVDVDVHKVYREADKVFSFMFSTRVAIVHNDKTTGTQDALAERQRGEIKSKLRRLLALPGGPEQMSDSPFWPAELLDNVRQQDGAEDLVRDLRNLLALSVSCRQRSTSASQSRWGLLRNLPWPSARHRQESTTAPQSLWGLPNFIVAHVGENAIADIVLRMALHLEEEWFEEKGLQSLKNMPIGSKHPKEGPLTSASTGPLPSSEAFAVVVIGSELRIQLDK